MFVVSLLSTGLACWGWGGVGPAWLGSSLGEYWWDEVRWLRDNQLQDSRAGHGHNNINMLEQSTWISIDFIMENFWKLNVPLKFKEKEWNLTSFLQSLTFLRKLHDWKGFIQNIEIIELILKVVLHLQTIKSWHPNRVNSFPFLISWRGQSKSFSVLYWQGRIATAI